VVLKTTLFVITFPCRSTSYIFYARNQSVVRVIILTECKEPVLYVLEQLYNYVFPEIKLCSLLISKTEL
jgi:hypothetical protein